MFKEKESTVHEAGCILNLAFYAGIVLFIIYLYFGNTINRENSNLLLKLISTVNLFLLLNASFILLVL